MILGNVIKMVVMIVLSTLLFAVTLQQGDKAYSLLTVFILAHINGAVAYAIFFKKKEEGATA